MGILFFGTSERPIDVDEFFIKCASCETHSWADIMVLSKYWHIYWVPIFPIDKEANIICKKCGLKRFGIPFDERLISNYEEVKGRFRHKWYLFSGIGLFILVILLALLLP